MFLLSSTKRQKNFYPRSPCGERRANVRAPRLGIAFLSTLSLRRATTANTRTALPVWISIHALLAESDQLEWRPAAC